MSDLVYSFCLGFAQFASTWVEGILFEEKAHFVARREEIVVADMLFCGGFTLGVGASGKFGHRMVGEREVGQELVRLGEQCLAGLRGEIVWNDQVAVALEGS